MPPSEMACKLHNHAIATGDLLMWTIYYSPADYPGKYVVRPHSVRNQAPYEAAILVATLSEARESLPPGLTSIGREPADDPVIVESWL